MWDTMIRDQVDRFNWKRLYGYQVLVLLSNQPIRLPPTQCNAFGKLLLSPRYAWDPASELGLTQGLHMRSSEGVGEVSLGALFDTTRGEYWVLVEDW